MMFVLGLLAGMVLVVLALVAVIAWAARDLPDQNREDKE